MRSTYIEILERIDGVMADLTLSRTSWPAKCVTPSERSNRRDKNDGERLAAVHRCFETFSLTFTVAGMTQRLGGGI